MDNSETTNTDASKTAEINLTSSSKKPNECLKIVLLGVLGLLTAVGLVYTGYWCGIKRSQLDEKPVSAPSSFLTDKEASSLTPTPLSVANTPTTKPTVSETEVFSGFDHKLIFEYQNDDEDVNSPYYPYKGTVFFEDSRVNYKTKLFDFPAAVLALINGSVQWEVVEKGFQRQTFYVTFNLGVAEGSDWYIVRYADSQAELIKIPGNIIGDAIWFNGKLLLRSWIYPTNESELLIFDPEEREFIDSAGNIKITTKSD